MGGGRWDPCRGCHREPDTSTRAGQRRMRDEPSRRLTSAFAMSAIPRLAPSARAWPNTADQPKHLCAVERRPGAPTSPYQIAVDPLKSRAPPSAGQQATTAPTTTTIMSSLAARTALRTAARSSRTKPAPLAASSSAFAQKHSWRSPQQSIQQQPLQARRAFSTTMAAKAGSAPAGQDPFDEPIQDMATYIHNYKIDSDLAVRGRSPSAEQQNLTGGTD